jgi:hypothetical protein
MKYRLITLAATAALALASAVPAQERDRERPSDRRDRNGDAQPVGASPSSSSTTRPATASYSDRYAILERNNIFVKDRSRPATRSYSSSSTATTRRSPEESLVVRGIAMEEFGYRAYVEDLNNSSTTRVSPGDPLGRGRVVAVALDAIQYEHDGRQSWIDIGSDLTGKQSAAVSPYSSASASTSPTSLPANVDLNDPSLTVEQRMRLRVQLQQQRGR